MKRTLEEIKKAEGFAEAVRESKNIEWGGLHQEIVYNAATNEVVSHLFPDRWSRTVYDDPSDLYYVYTDRKLTQNQLAELIANQL
nr:MAG TPA_asm: hypothetical protein [Caudoviricetes sp.]